MKRKIKFQFQGNIYTVDVERHGNEITIERDNGEIHHVTLLPTGEIDRIVPPKQEGMEKEEGREFSDEPSKLFAQTEEHAAAAKEGFLLAPMSGVIKELKTQSGQTVQKGKLLLIMEAMKMDIEVNAQASGVVKEIYVQQGDFVNSGQKLMKL